jgi:thioredoxin
MIGTAVSRRILSLPRCIARGAALETVIFGGLPMSNAVAVNEESFNKEVLESTIPVLVDFWAAWCGPCRAIAPIVEQIAGEHSGRLKVVKLDVDENGEVSIRYGVMNIPTLLVFKGGKVVERIVGAMPKPALMSRIQPHLQG